MHDSCKSCGVGHYDPADDTIAMVNSILGGIVAAPTPTPIRQPNAAFGGWDMYLSAATCFRTNKQRFLAFSKVFSGNATSAAGANGSDILQALLASMALPTAAAPGAIDVITMKDDDDVASVQGLALVAVAVSFCVRVTNDIQANPSGGAGDIGGYNNFGNLGFNIGCAMSKLLRYELTHAADASEKYVTDTALSHFKRYSGNYLPTPPLVFIQKENQRERLYYQAANFGAGITTHVPPTTRVEADLELRHLFLNDPRCGCDWPMHLCGPPKLVEANRHALGQKTRMRWKEYAKMPADAKGAYAYLTE